MPTKPTTKGMSDHAREQALRKGNLADISFPALKKAVKKGKAKQEKAHGNRVAIFYGGFVYIVAMKAGIIVTSMTEDDYQRQKLGGPYVDSNKLPPVVKLPFEGKAKK